MRFDIHTVLMILAFVCFLLSACGIPYWTAGYRPNFTAVGLALWVLAVLIGAT